jgi:anti-sigma B factor antagonist
LARLLDLPHNPSMPLKLGVHRVLDVTRLDLNGSLSLGEEGTMFRVGVRDLVWEGHKKLLLGNSGLRYSDSSGLGELVSAFTLLHNRGGEIVLAALTNKMTSMLQITKLTSVYPVFLTVEEALHYFDTKRSLGVQVWRRVYGDVVVLEIAGSLAPERGLSVLDDAIQSAAGDIICIFTQVLDVSPEACSVLKQAAAALREQRRQLVLANVEERLEDALLPLEMAGIRKFQSLDAALAACGIEIPVHDRWK